MGIESVRSAPAGALKPWQVKLFMICPGLDKRCLNPDKADVALSLAKNNPNLGGYPDELATIYMRTARGLAFLEEHPLVRSGQVAKALGEKVFRKR